MWLLAANNNFHRNFYTEEMKNKIASLFLKHSYNIVKYLFWFYFLLILGYHYLISENIPRVMEFIFWFLSGVYIGFILSNKSKAYNENKN